MRNDDHRNLSKSRRARVRPPEHDAGIDELDHLAGVAHELRNLLDGSLRCVMLAQRELRAEGSTAPGATVAAASTQHLTAAVTAAQLQLDVAVSALERMASLIHAAMQGPSLSIGSTLLAGTKPATLTEALAHALAVVRPFAQEQRVGLTHAVDAQTRILPSGPLYSVILNGLRNATQAVAACGGGGVHITTALRDDNLELVIEDDGHGLTPRALEMCFERGFTTRNKGSGLGLTIARSIIERIGGRIELGNRTDRVDRRRPGAVLRVVVPLRAINAETFGPDTNP